MVHENFGVGVYKGLSRVKSGFSVVECVVLEYKHGDKVHVPLENLHFLDEYIGPKNHDNITDLRKTSWEKEKFRAERSAGEIVDSFVEMYGKRANESGIPFEKDGELLNDLKLGFKHIETKDQLLAYEEIKNDMEDSKPMDRLLCGDVGFGKTEVAIRAAFKAVDNSKQVVVLVPTTILAFQHYKTFSRRLKDLPVRVDYLNRFRTNKDKTMILKDLANGKIDILIGTHQLISKNVIFQDLGLLIVDEEQKFGVAVKEKIRSLKNNIDVLTLSATPIPRTLQFSLMAARDLSIIATPPPNRYPINSEVVRFNETQIRNGILYELQRGGQVFFIHNRVENIMEIAGLIQRLVPDARIALGHGRMEGRKLEQTLLGFMNGEYDILIACLLYTSPSPRDRQKSRMPSSA